MATKKTTPDPLPKVVYAQASPKSIGGSSLFDATRSIDHRNVEAYMSEEPVVRDAVARLQAAGFQVLQVSPCQVRSRLARWTGCRSRRQRRCRPIWPTTSSRRSMGV